MHPKVVAFKKFINEHPKLREEIRKSGRSWQEYYEKWILLGEDDPLWDKFEKDSNESEKKSGNKSEFFSQLMKLTENVDVDKVQKQVHELSSTVATLQELLGQFQDKKKSNQYQQNQPYHWFRD
ncbi:Putative coat protein [Oceanobacillus limi]|uniref:Putative coat protein n=1 Tax=Oceanobacillus limi TaxID=930131 RepID=A0A1I0DCA6_9BACI|nr:Putative coat protein [Oceanobacillus limi]